MQTQGGEPWPLICIIVIYKEKRSFVEKQRNVEIDDDKVAKFFPLDKLN